MGSAVIIDCDIARLGGTDVVTACAFDDMIGIAVMIEAFNAISDPKVDVYTIATVQEKLV